MTPFDYMFALFIVVGIAASLAMLAYHHLHRGDERFNHPNHTDTTALTFCQGCGCRHRSMWMRWTPTGLFRCVVCCDETVSDTEGLK